MRTSARLTAIALSLAWATLLLAGCSQVSTSPVGDPGEVVSVTGTVESVDVSEMQVDGPARIRLRTEEHGRVTVLVPACEGPCALKAVQRLGELQRGARWRVTAEVTTDGGLSVHDDALHGLAPAGSE